MDLSEIHYHDARILRVVEDTGTDTLTMEVDYPVDWDKGIFEPRRLIFADAYNYQVFEQPFQGSPTILDVSIAVEHPGWLKSGWTPTQATGNYTVPPLS